MSTPSRREDVNMTTASRREDGNMTTASRRVTFKQSRSCWTGWDNPFQEGSEICGDAELILSRWREGTSYRDGPEENTEQLELAGVEPTTTTTIAAKEQTSNKLYNKFLKWKEKKILLQNLFKMYSKEYHVN